MNEKMQICILGNSHVACLKNGWEKIRTSFGNIELIFFAQRGHKGLVGLEANKEKGVLLPKIESLRKALLFTSGGSEYIDLKTYNVCILCGLEFDFPTELFFFKEKQFLSETVFLIALDSYFKRTFMFKILLEIRKFSLQRVYIMHCPLHSMNENKYFSSNRKIKSVFSKLTGNNNKINNNKYLESLSVINEFFIKKYNIEIIRQPLKTIDGYNTLKKYSKESVRLSVGDERDMLKHPDVENRHMNTEYGILALEELFHTLLKK